MPAQDAGIHVCTLFGPIHIRPPRPCCKTPLRKSGNPPVACMPDLIENRRARCMIITANDGLPVIRTTLGSIAAQLVKEMKPRRSDVLRVRVQSVRVPRGFGKNPIYEVMPRLAPASAPQTPSMRHSVRAGLPQSKSCARFQRHHNSDAFFTRPSQVISSYGPSRISIDRRCQ